MGKTVKLQVASGKGQTVHVPFVACRLELHTKNQHYIHIHSQTSKTGQHLQCTCTKCRIALFLARETCSRSYGYYILYIGVIGRLTKMLEIEIVITVGMQFRVGFGGSQNAVYRKCVTRCGWVGKT